MEHIAYTDQALRCSKCSFLLQVLVKATGRTLYCGNPECSLYVKQFIAPTVRLEPAPEGEVNQVATPKPPVNRFAAFNPDEREIMRVLLQEHSNTVSQCAIALDVRVAAYLLAIEELEAEVNDA